MYLINVWINKGSGWIVESIESQYINISTYRPLSGSYYMDVSVELRSPRKGLINIKNKDQNFLWCHVRHINPSKEHPERITKEDINLLSILLVQKKLHQKIKSLLVILIMLEFSFPCKKKVLVKLRWKSIFVSMCLVTKMDWFFRFSLQIKNLKIQWICCF